MKKNKIPEVPTNISIMDDNEQILDFFSQSNFFKKIPESLLHELKHKLKFEKYSKDEVILKQGIINHKIFFLYSGKLGVYIEHKQISVIQRIGDLFGEMSVISDQPVSADIIALKDSEVLTINARDFKENYDENIGIDIFMMQLFTQVLSDKLFITSIKAKDYEKNNFDLKSARDNLKKSLEEKKNINEELLSQKQLLEKSKAELALRIDERTIKLQQSLLEKDKLLHQLSIAKSTAEQAQASSDAANKAKSEFLANMSHEIRTPMNAVIGLTNLAINANPEQKILNYLIKIENASYSLLRIINDIMDVSKIEAGKMFLEPIEFNLHDLLYHLADLFRGMAIDKNIDLIMSLESTCPTFLFGDRLRLEQILMNLIGNALKFTSEGEVEISVKDMNKTNNQSLVEFSIRDTGIGLSDEQIDKLFMPFVQADGSTTRKYGGTGLGLSISKQLINLMNGDILIKSNLGQGSIFQFTIPFEQRDPSNANPITPPQFLKDMKVLIVDSSLTSRTTLQDTISCFGFKPCLIENGANALLEIQRALNDKPYQLVIINTLLLDVNGITTTQQIMETTHWDGINKPLDKATPRIIIITSDDHDEAFKSQAKEAGVDALLSSPISRSILFYNIMTIFGRKQSHSHRARQLPADNKKIIEDIPNTKVLLVEDSLINQQIEQELLEGVGIQVEIANNGVEAVEAVKNNDYCAVLMDIQMPLMDGYDATRAIRENPDNASLPIIAMTANAMSGDRKKCLNAGMNDYVSKPIDLKQLLCVLASQLKPEIKETIQQTQSTNTRNQTTQTVQTTQSKIDHYPGIDMQSALNRVNNNKTLLIKLLLEFKTEYANSATDINNALSQGELEQARKLSHKIKGIASNISLIQVFNAASQLELAIENKQASTWPELTDIFASAIKQILPVIDSLQPETENHPEKQQPDAVAKAATTPIDKTALQADMIKLDHHLSLFEHEAVQSFETLKPALMATGFSQESKYSVAPYQTIAEQIQYLSNSLKRRSKG